MSVTILQITQSSNIDAREEKYDHGDVIIAIEQTAGRGQRGNKWSSHAGENLTFTTVLKPSFLAAKEQFLLSKVVALAIVDTLKAFGIEAMIKWTNDIYVGDKKICGVLIENDLCGEKMTRAIVGIGLNVNQREFDEWIPNPTSMNLEREQKFDIMEVFDTLYTSLMLRYGQLETNKKEQIEEDYHRLIYRCEKLHTFAYPDGRQFAGIIKKVAPSGELFVEIDGVCNVFKFTEIRFVI